MNWIRRLLGPQRPIPTEFDHYIDDVRNNHNINPIYFELMEECDKCINYGGLLKAKPQIREVSKDLSQKDVEKLILRHSEAMNDPRSRVSDYELFVIQWICLYRKEDVTGFIQNMLFGNYVEDYRHAHSGLSYLFFFIAAHGYKKEEILKELSEKRDHLYYFHDDAFELMVLWEQDPSNELPQEFWDGLMF
jgi:hypothetical protein